MSRKVVFEFGKPDYDRCTCGIGETARVMPMSHAPNCPIRRAYEESTKHAGQYRPRLTKEDFDKVYKGFFEPDNQTEALKNALQLVLDCVDYTNGACNVNSMVGAVLPKEIIRQAKAAIARAEATQ